MRSRLAVLVAVLAVGLGGAHVEAAGQEGATPARLSDTASPDSVHPGAELRVYLLTMGRGDLVWEKFGHNAIRVVDPSRGTDLAWNWGIFDFTQEAFWPRLLTGRMLYSMGVWETDRTLYEYDYYERPVWQQELDMTPAQKLELQRLIHEHWEPENRDYRYDYYRDNCSTRVRDVLDAALGGAIARTLAGDTTATTYRSHTRRLLADAVPAYAGIQLVLGHRADRPITAWEETFLPLRLQAYLRDVEIEGEDGTLRPLVREETLLVPADRPGAPVAPPTRVGWALGIGLLVGAALVGLAALAGRGALLARLAFTLLAGGWALVAGVAGTILLAAWLFTEHWFWAMNENVLQVGPLHLVLAALLVPLVWRARPTRWSVGLAAVVAGLSLLGFGLQLLPGFDQVNGEILALTVPANLGLAVALARLAGRFGPEPRASSAATA